MLKTVVVPQAFVAVNMDGAEPGTLIVVRDVNKIAIRDLVLAPAPALAPAVQSIQTFTPLGIVR